MNKRLTALRKILRLSQSEFAEKIGLKQTSLSNIEQGINTLTERNIISICNIFHVNENWLRTGEGDMFITVDKNYDEFFSIYENLNIPLQEFLNNVAKDLLDAQQKLKKEE